MSRKYGKYCTNISAKLAQAGLIFVHFSYVYFDMGVHEYNRNWEAGIICNFMYVALKVVL